MAPLAKLRLLAVSLTHALRQEFQPMLDRCYGIVGRFPLDALGNRFACMAATKDGLAMIAFALETTAECLRFTSDPVSLRPIDPHKLIKLLIDQNRRRPGLDPYLTNLEEYVDALSKLEPQPTLEAFLRARELHEYFRRRYRPPRGFLSSAVEMLPMDSKDGVGTLLVPIFVDALLQSTQFSRDCTICLGTFADMTDGSRKEEKRWTRHMAAFPGDWAHRVRPFMSHCSLVACAKSHKFDICRSCLSKQIEAQMETGSRYGTRSLICPVDDGCGHIYADEELRKILSPGAYARYDELRLFSLLSASPDFRWCLGENCQSGQEYFFPPLPSSPTNADVQVRYRARCHECKFAMCFRHQIPWHEGLSCAEYDGAPRDADHDASLDWIRNNTKACPGCRIPVEKRGGCLHMECSVCEFEFCWVCLADWAVLDGTDDDDDADDDNNTYRSRHASRCYFPREDLLR